MYHLKIRREEKMVKEETEGIKEEAVTGRRKRNKNKYMKITDWNIEQGDWQREKRKTGK
jgi:hypothetical protein